MYRFIFVIFFVVSNLLPVTGQIPVGAWREHLSWKTAEAVAVAGRKVYCSNGVGICIYDVQSRQLDKLTKINGLSDAGVTAMQYAATIDAVVVGYANGNLDIVAGSKIYNIPGIKRYGQYLNKRINHIFVLEKYAYLSCPFGIVVVDLQLRQIHDMYIIGDQGISAEVFSMTEYNGYFYAATAQGLKKADSENRELADFKYWEKVNDTFGNTLLQTVATERYLYACDDQQIFVFDGLAWNPLILPHTFEKIHRLTISGNNLLVSTSNAVFIYNFVTNS